MQLFTCNLCCHCVYTWRNEHFVTAGEMCTGSLSLSPSVCVFSTQKDYVYTDRI